MHKIELKRAPMQNVSKIIDQILISKNSFQNFEFFSFFKQNKFPHS